ncbi:putative disease resistance protein RGA3 [Corylus avellana]|uniref:putative disease resistance protein RGA3 n=1 Tax=Corylus avellana TaxID=13451 RepID=UPI00286A4545|nr:putative disease resistance protein RGA3 [Corylus avellana]
MNTVSTIKAVLLDAEHKQANNPILRIWLETLDDSFYDADDLLDAISTDALQREILTRDKKAKKVRIFFSKSNQLISRFKVAHKIKAKIKAIRKRLDEIYYEGQRFNLDVRKDEETRVSNSWRDSDVISFVHPTTVIGREDDKKAVIDLLMNSNVEDNVLILPIVGIGVLGKTILAKFVYNDHQIVEHFELRMWVYVSYSFHVTNIVKVILESATYTIQPAVEMNTLVGQLKEIIGGKKYFLVLDDVWNEDHEKWSELKEVLMGGARGSRILVTTRSEIVARTIRQESVAGIIGTVKSYSLKGLDEDASWYLFKQRAFKIGQEPENSIIVRLGKEIVQKCLSVPLVISTIAGLLYSINSEKELLFVKKNGLSRISQNKNDILPTLKLSYDHLPSHLKHCFTYCSLFLKDYMIDKSTLIKLWIAQGFVKLSDQNRCLEDVCDEYFMDLLWRSFFQEPVMDEFDDKAEETLLKFIEKIQAVPGHEE